MRGSRPQTGGTGHSSPEVRFESLYDSWYAHVWAYCRRRVAVGHVDDVVAETFLTAWRRIDDVPEGDGARLWLYRVAYRVVGHQWRSRSRRRRLDERLRLARPGASTSPEESAMLNDELSRVLEAAGRLKPSDAEILRLVSWERLSPGEIAEILDLTPNAASQRISRARATLSEQFQRLEPRTPDRTPAAGKGGTP